MKKKLFTFLGNEPKNNFKVPGKLASRTNRWNSMPGVCYLTDAEQAQAGLLEKVKAQAKATVDAEFTTRQYVNADQVTGAINKQLEGLSLEALRAYESDKTTMTETIKRLAAQAEKLEARNAFTPGGDHPQAEDHLRKLLDANKEAIQTRFKNPDSKGEISFNLRAAADMTTANTVDNTTNSVPVAMLDSMSMAAFVPKRRGVQFINDIADRTVVSKITQYKTWLEEGTEQGAFAIVAEGALKPLVSDGVVRNFAKAKKVAGKYVVTEEFEKFFTEIYTIIKRIIMDKMVRDYIALLVVDLNAQAVGYTGTTLDATIVAPQDYDAIAAVASQIMSLNFNPDVIILNPADLWRIRLTKDTQGRYLFPVQNATNGAIDLFGLDVVVSTYQTSGSFTLGEAGLFKIEEEPITVRMGYGIDVTTGAQTASNTQTTVVTAVSSDIDTNRMRVIVEVWFNDWLGSNNIGSYVKASFATVKTALLKP